MIWLTWRQHRRQALFTLVTLGVLALIVVPTGLAMHTKYDSSGLAACQAALGKAPMITQTEAVSNCASLAHQFEQQFGNLVYVAVLFVILPVLVGVFFGAPLVSREVEQGTHRLVWTQGVSRAHWALVKFGLIGAITAVLAVGYALGVSWWFGPLVSTTSRLGYFAFDVQGVVRSSTRCSRWRWASSPARTGRRCCPPWGSRSSGTPWCGWRSSSSPGRGTCPRRATRSPRTAR
ncbi:ABC transporter permease subunit [Amycolatopsis sp., V23-08]|uniref:ABC transporter permease subunit n=1 Tax=Amycolatopsis heterodermiae TaxID=3110235 RepID=A0ABU5R218_9PSEU|nr:hypothetical protein [Amycolatopsis sp., V23-08]MEA5360213.1 ABC transporter permease subunit [Amycolatopsis sp., V23-08]